MINDNDSNNNNNNKKCTGKMYTSVLVGVIFCKMHTSKSPSQSFFFSFCFLGNVVTQKKTNKNTQKTYMAGKKN